MAKARLVSVFGESPKESDIASRLMVERQLRLHYIAGMDWSVETMSVVDAEMVVLPVALHFRLIRPLDTVESVRLPAHRALQVRRRVGKGCGCIADQ